MGVESIENFLQFVMRTSTVPMSMTLSKQVLETRQRMQDQADGAMLRIARGMEQAEYLHEMMKDMKVHQADFNANQNYTFKKKVNMPKLVPLEPHETAYQWCTTCNQLCCQICEWPVGPVLSPCTYFHNGKGCPKCRGCPRESHVRQKNKEITEEIEQVTVLDGKKNACEAAQKGISAAQNAIQNQVSEGESLTKEILMDMQILKDCREELDKIAFKKVNHSNVNLFEQMIKEEEMARSKGYQGRVASLKQAKARAEAIEKMVGAQSMVQLFPAYKEEIESFVQQSGPARRRRDDTCSTM